MLVVLLVSESMSLGIRHGSLVSFMDVEGNVLHVRLAGHLAGYLAGVSRILGLKHSYYLLCS